MADWQLNWCKEPRLLFGHGQALEDPKDGLTLFGPLDAGKTFGVRVGVIGREEGVARYRRWAESIQNPIIPEDGDVARFMYPGFNPIYGVEWPTAPLVSEIIPSEEFDVLKNTDSHQRVYDMVSVYADRIIRAKREDEQKPDVWFVVVPEEVHRDCRPKSRVSARDGYKPEVQMTKKQGVQMASAPALFEDLNEAATAYRYEVDFHNQLKARLLNEQIAIQIVREKTFALDQQELVENRDRRDIRRFRAEIAWNLTNAVYYKTGARPWKVDGVRDGVCYVGLVFKQDDRHADPRMACCAAQMFLDSGDGVVFKGAVGPWYNSERGDFHLKREAAADLISKAVEAYRRGRSDGAAPKELFVHGRVFFEDDEWEGFRDGVPEETNVVGVSIRKESRTRLYHPRDHAPLRGLSYVSGQYRAMLLSNGYIPRLQTYPGREVPVPLSIHVCKGRADIKTVLSDVMGLTKLNYNTTNFSDGLPVTLRFADAIGEILTAGPIESTPPLPFRYYI